MNGDDGSSRYNYFEATGGIASMEMGELSQVHKSVAGLPFAPASFGEPPPDSFCWPEGVGDSHSVYREPHPRAARTRSNGVNVDVEGVAGALYENTDRGSRGGAANLREPPAYRLESYLAGATR